MVDRLLVEIRLAGLPAPVPEYRFHPVRRWRFDWAWPDRRLGLEFEGGAYTGGRHVRGAGFEADCLKYSMAALLGWRVLRVTAGMIRDGTALRLVRAALTTEEAG